MMPAGHDADALRKIVLFWLADAYSAQNIT